MQQRALVIRTYGNQELAKSMAAAMESQELKRLQAKIGVRASRDKDYWQEKINEANKKYKIKPMHPIKRKLLSVIGLMVALAHAS